MCLAALAVCALAVLALATGCASARPRLDALGQPLRTIRAVHFVGLDHVARGELLGGLGSRPESGVFSKSRTAYDEAELELDLRRIVAFYAQHGYFSARASAAVKEVGRDQVDLAVTIEEGAPTRVASVEIVGAPDGGPGGAALATTLGVTPGQVFVHARYLAGKDAVLHLLVDHGYLFATVRGEVAVDRGACTAVVRVVIDAGPLVRFGETRFEGAGRVPESALRARLAWRQGQVVRPELLALTEGRLYRLGRFSMVRFDYDRERRAAVVAMTVRVAESTRHEVRLGGGVGIDLAHYEVRVRAGYTARGFLSPLTTLRLDLRPALTFLRVTGDQPGVGGEATALIEQEDFLAPLLRLGVEVDYAVQNTEAYSLRGPQLRLSLDHPFLQDRLNIDVGWQLRDQSFFNVDAAVAPEQAAWLGLESPYRLGFFDLGSPTTAATTRSRCAAASTPSCAWRQAARSRAERSATRS